MKHILASTLALGGLLFAVPQTCWAKTPPEVLEPYKAYRAALKENDHTAAADMAYEAWQKAEDILGDSKTTGDLAFNFADLRPSHVGKSDARKKVEKAFGRSIALSHFHGDQSIDVELQRRVAYADYALAHEKVRFTTSGYITKVRFDPLNDLKDRIEETGRENSTYLGEYYTLLSTAARKQERHKAQEKFSLQAISAFDSADDPIASAYPFFAKLNLADAYLETDQIVKAGLAYQDVISDLDDSYGHDNRTSSAAYAMWLSVYDKVKADPDAYPGGEAILAYQVPKQRESRVEPLLRVPPVMPAKFLQGSQSGWVQVQFDVDENGVPYAPFVLQGTHQSLSKSSLDSVLRWRYSPNAPAEDRTGITTVITYRLRDERGRLLPMPRPQPKQ